MFCLSITAVWFLCMFCLWWYGLSAVSMLFFFFFGKPYLICTAKGILGVVPGRQAHRVDDDMRWQRHWSSRA